MIFIINIKEIYIKRTSLLQY